jgi:hypothetical protein
LGHVGSSLSSMREVYLRRDACAQPDSERFSTFKAALKTPASRRPDTGTVNKRRATRR